ncbi:MAG: uroporphyrinogen-III synthase [Methylocella sp.]|nr:MAG: uroporphyrinogen-III synthase [Hyphomicrobiales bacterium]
MNGKTVALLENRVRDQLGGLVRKNGGRPFSAPALAEVPDIDTAYISSLLQDWVATPAKVVIFQTGVGTKALFETTDALGVTATLLRLLSESLVVVRGPKPTAVLRSRGVRIDLNAKEPYTSAEILEALAPVALNGECVIVQRYGEPNVELDKALEARGATVIEVPTYRWAMPANTQPLVELMDALARGEIDAVAFTNASQASNLFILAEQLGRTESLRANLNKTLVASIGPVCSKRLEELGVVVEVEAHPPKLGPFVQALGEALSGR